MDPRLSFINLPPRAPFDPHGGSLAHMPQQPTDRCCAWPTYVLSTKIETRTLAKPPLTTDRWIVLVHWQCHVTEEHAGEWWYTTDDPDHEMPYRRVEDPVNEALRWLPPIVRWMLRPGRLFRR